MPGYARDYTDPKAAFDKRAQEYERLIERLNSNLAEAQRGYGKGLTALREAEAFLLSIFRSDNKDPQEWMKETLSRARPLQNQIAAAIQDLEQSR